MWWLNDERQRGFAVSLPKLVGPGKTYRAVADLDAKKAGKALLFNTGAQLQRRSWLNGKRILPTTKPGPAGTPAREPRHRPNPREGRNTIVIETGGEFFLSVTDDDAW